MARDNAQVMPEGWKVELVEAKGQTWQIYKDQIEWADRAIATILAGQPITTEGGKAFSDLSIFEQIAATFIDFTAISAARTLHEQAVVPWAIDNFGDADDAPYAYWDTTPPEDQQKKATALVQLGNAMLVIDQALRPSNKRVNLEAVLAKFGVPLLDGAAPAMPLPGQGSAPANDAEEAPKLRRAA